MTGEQLAVISLLSTLERLVSDFDDQGATHQGTELSAALDEFYADIEEAAAERERDD